MFGFTLSWDEIARTSQAIGDVNTLPLELQGLTTTVTTPAIYALGTVTTVVSLLVMAVALGTGALLRRRAAPRREQSVRRCRSLLVINPNTSSAVTALLRAASCRPRSARRSRCAALTARFGAPYIVGEAELRGRRARRARRLGRGTARARLAADAVLIGCFGDPGLFALREGAGVPVSGLAEAAFAAAAATAALPSSPAASAGGRCWSGWPRRSATPGTGRHPHGGAHRRAAGGRPGRRARLLADACREAASRFGAEAVILGGAGLAGMAADIAARCRCR